MRSKPAEGNMQSVLPGLGVACAFRPEYLDFDRGIHVGNLNDHERITRILKLALEARYGEPFVTERWGRGVYWHSIGFLPRADRAAKPVSSGVSFSCSKLFLSVDTAARVARFGWQTERGMTKAPRAQRQLQLKDDWDWHRLIAGLQPRGAMVREIERLVRAEGFQIYAGSWGGGQRFSAQNYPGAGKLRSALEAAPANAWAGFQLYYAMGEDEVRAATGLDLVGAMLAAYSEVVPVMNLTMQTELTAAR